MEKVTLLALAGPFFFPKQSGKGDRETDATHKKKSGSRSQVCKKQ